MPGAELFVGNLDRDIQRREIEDVFEKYGKILRCDVKNKGKIFFIFYRKKTILFFLFIFYLRHGCCILFS